MRFCGVEDEANIHGVDIDEQAVEVTKLSLLLKVLEGVGGEAVHQWMLFARERALPDLGANIKCGNSLIGSDYFDGRLDTGGIDDEERRRVNAFDWEEEFPEVFAGKNPGFDAVIGNPPYIRIQGLQQWQPGAPQYFAREYVAASKGNYDIYAVFVERGLSLLNKHGRLAFILPHKFFNARYGEPLRKLLGEGKHLSHIVHFRDQQVFAGASTYTCLMFLDKDAQRDFSFVGVADLGAWRTDRTGTAGRIAAGRATGEEWNFVVGEAAPLLDKLARMPTKLEDVTTRIFQGIKTSADKIYILEQLERCKNRVRVRSPAKEADYWLEPGLLHPLVKGGDSRRYSLSRTKRLLIFPYAPQRRGASDLIDADTLRKEYPLSWEYLLANKSYLENRENGKVKGPRWYGYIYPKALDVMPLPKLFTPDIAPRASFSIDAGGEVFFTGGVAGGYGILVSEQHSREYVLGLLNSRLLEWVIRQTATQMRGGWFSFESRFIRTLPIRPIDFSKPSDVKQHALMVSLVRRMLDLHKRLPEAKTPHEKELIDRDIAATDRRIDELVYELYGLTEKEIRVVEEATAKSS